MRTTSRITKEQAMSFLLTHIVVENQCHFELTPASLFEIMTMASSAEEMVNKEEGVIAHEVIESIAADFIKSR